MTSARWELACRPAIRSRPGEPAAVAAPAEMADPGARPPNNNIRYSLRSRPNSRILILFVLSEVKPGNPARSAPLTLGHGLCRAQAVVERGETSWNHEAHTRQIEAVEE